MVFACAILFNTRLQNRLLRVRGWGTLFLMLQIETCGCGSRWLGRSKRHPQSHGGTSRVVAMQLPCGSPWISVMSFTSSTSHQLSEWAHWVWQVSLSLSLSYWVAPHIVGDVCAGNFIVMPLSQCDLRSCETNIYTRNTRQGVLPLLSLINFFLP